MNIISKTIRGFSVEIGSDTRGLSAALKDVEKNSRDISKELRKVENLLRFNPDDTTLLAQKQELLGQQVETTSKKLNTLKEAQGEVNRQFKEGEISEQVYRDFQRELIKTSSQLEHFENKLNEAEGANKDLGKRLNEVGANLQQAGKKLKDVGTTMSTKFTAPILAGFGLVTKGTEELRQDLARLETNAEQAGVGADKIGESLTRLSGISDETDSNVEALSNLLATGFDEQGMTQAMDALSGAVVKFPDTLKIEGLADGLQETLATGKAIGPFAEMLERTGVDLDTFNEGLADAAEQGEQQNYVLQALAETGLAEVNEAYRENNKEIVESQEAQAELQRSLAEMGNAIAPIMTKITEEVAGLVSIFNNLTDEQKNVALAAGGLLAAIGPILVIAGQLTTAVGNLIPVMTKLGTTISTSFAPLAIGGAIIAGVTLIISRLREAQREAELVKKDVQEIFDLEEAKEQLDTIDKEMEKILSGKTVGKMRGDIIAALEDEEKILEMLPESDRERLEVLRKQKAEAEGRTEELTKQRDLEKEAVSLTEQLQEKRDKLTLGEIEEDDFVKFLEGVIAREDLATDVRARFQQELNAIQQDFNDLEIEYPEIETPEIEIPEIETEKYEDNLATIEDIEEEWRNKREVQLKEGLDRELLLLEQRKQSEIQEAEDAGADTVDIAAYFEEERNRVIAKYEEKTEKERKAFEEKYSNLLEDSSKDRLDILEQEKEEALAKADELEADTTAIEEYYSKKRQEILDKEIEEKEKLEEQWSRRVLNQTSSREELLDAEERKAIARAEEIEADVTAIKEYYANERQKIIDEEQKKEDAKEEKRIKSREELEERWNEKLFNLTHSRLEIIANERKEAIEEAKELGADTTAIKENYALEALDIIKNENSESISQLENQKIEALKIAKELGIEKEKIIEIYSNRAVELFSKEKAESLDELEEQKEESLRIAEELGLDKAAITQYYANEQSRIEEEALKEKEERAEKEKQIVQSTAKAWADSYMEIVGSLVDGSKSIKDVLKDLLIQFLEMKQKEVLVQQMAELAKALAASWWDWTAVARAAAAIAASTAAFEGAKALVRGLATGGVVAGGSDQLFRLGDGREDEAVVPLNARVLSNLGSQIAANMPAAGGANEISITINQNIANSNDARRAGDSAVNSLSRKLKNRGVVFANR